MSLAVLSAVPHADVEISDDPETVQQEVVAVCRQLLPGWTESAEGAQVRPLTCLQSGLPRDCPFKRQTPLGRAVPLS